MKMGNNRLQSQMA